MTTLHKVIESFDTQSRVYSKMSEEDKAMVPLEFSSDDLILVSTVLKFSTVKT